MQLNFFALSISLPEVGLNPYLTLIWKGFLWVCFQEVGGTAKIRVKGALSGLKQFMAPESFLEMMKNAFYFTLKALLTFWSFGKTARLER